MRNSKVWWPICAECGKVVDDLEILPVEANQYKNPVRRFKVTCHGETEESMAGLWAIFEIAQSRGRLPQAFTKHVTLQPK